MHTFLENNYGIEKRNIFDILLMRSSTIKEDAWSDKGAELTSLVEILNSSALVTVSDLKGNIIHANELFCSVSKYRLDEIINQPHSIIRHPDTPSHVFKEMWHTIGNGKVWQGEIKNRAKDGTEYWVIATIAPVMGKNGKPIKYISIRYDITKQKQVEEELRESKNKIDNELLENIAYAKHIHSALLSNKKSECSLDDSFLIYKAQKIISGDFYKITRNENKFMVVVGDSTGHGIAASYISVLALNTLSRVMQFCCDNPSKILKIINSELNKITRFNSAKNLHESADMMVSCIDKSAMKLTYSSAKMKAFIIRNDEVLFLEKDACTIGEKTDEDFTISTHTMDLQEGDAIYMLTDGIIDQFGGAKNKRIGYKKIVAEIKNLQSFPMSMQKRKLEEFLLEWQGDNEQTDDMTLFGIKI